MSNVAIRVENLSKEYNLGVIGSGTLYKDIQSFWARLRGKQDPNSKLGIDNKISSSSSSFLALDNVSFDIEKGDIVGIIGKNGAGKSTLLKIISRITSPSKGSIKINGRVGSLLEVGTGFHPELTGRENIYLNGAILGMRKLEITKKLDEIIAFSGVEKFIDTPVKRYSSGMYVRLAFAVASHLDTEILLIDEVLAVGDAEFQKKCLGKMDDISKNEGRTVVFVSHNMGAILNLCNNCMLVDNGIVRAIGVTRNVVNEYVIDSKRKHETSIIERKDRSGNGKVKITNFIIENQDGNTLIKSFDHLKIQLTFDDKIKHCMSCQVLIGFYDMNSLALFRFDSGEIKTDMLISNKLVVETGEVNLPPVYCSVNIALLVDGEMSDYIINAYNFSFLENFKENVKVFPQELATMLIESKFYF
jgi:lipopolysaccharide transport system ATP-binding protein